MRQGEYLGPYCSSSTIYCRCVHAGILRVLVASKQVPGCFRVRLFMDNDILVTLRAADRAAGDQRREDHVLERIAVAQGEPRSIVDHAVQDKPGRRVRRGAET